MNYTRTACRLIKSNMLILPVSAANVNRSREYFGNILTDPAFFILPLHGLFIL